MRRPPCRYCDDPRTCPRQDEFNQRLYEAFREQPFSRAMSGSSDFATEYYLTQFADQLYRQRVAIRERIGYEPNELLLPLCASDRTLEHRLWGGLGIIITSEVRRPTLRYRKDMTV